MNCPAADDLTRFRVAAATMSLMGQNIADMLRRNNVNIVENNEGGEEVQVNGGANGDDEEEEDGVNDAQEVGHDEGEEENDLHPADVMEQNHNQVEGEGEGEEEPRGENGLGQVQQPRSLKRQLIDVKMEPSGLSVRQDLEDGYYGEEGEDEYEDGEPFAKAANLELSLEGLGVAAAAVSELRARNQRDNSKQTEACPVCGDKANGLHYGIYTCEACKNFFKRSVVTTRPFLCKGDNTCDIRLYDERGVRRKTSRCQACRFRACLDQGMSHGGPRVGLRGGRHHRSNGGSSSGSSSIFPQASLQPPPQQLQGSIQQQRPMSHTSSFDSSIAEPEEEVDEFAYSGNGVGSNGGMGPIAIGYSQNRISPPRNPLLLNGSADVKGRNGNSNSSANAFIDCTLESLATEDLKNEVGILQSRLLELECSLREKDRQLTMKDSQVMSLRKRCNLLERERNRTASAAAGAGGGGGSSSGSNSSMTSMSGGGGGSESLLKSMLQQGKKSAASSSVMLNGFQS